MRVSVVEYRDLLRDDTEAAFDIHSKEQIQQLKKAMARLPEDKREILLLSKYQEKNYKEIGEILGCNEGAVKVRVFRALHDLRVLYHQYEKNEIL